MCQKCDEFLKDWKPDYLRLTDDALHAEYSQLEMAALEKVDKPFYDANISLANASRLARVVKPLTNGKTIDAHSLILLGLLALLTAPHKQLGEEQLEQLLRDLTAVARWFSFHMEMGTPIGTEIRKN